MAFNFPIDMIYLWCDGSDPSFQKRKRKYLNEGEEVNNLSTGDIRFFDNGELMYSLRSLEINAPWINHVYIVTDRQIPSWLNTSYSKVSIVDHSSIMPSQNIPCFNSSVIERYIAFIPGLSEYFLYGNDDTFFGEYVTPSFFFLGNKPIVRMNYFENDSKEYTYEDIDKLRGSVSFWGETVLNAWRLLFNEYNIKKQVLLEPHHNIDAFKKSDYIRSFKHYQKYLELSMNRFREKTDIQRLLFSMDSVYRNRAILSIQNHYSKIRKYLFWIKPLNLDGYYIQDKKRSLLALNFIHPKLFCINNSDKTVASHKIWEKRFLEKRFPNKSFFEK